MNNPNSLKNLFYKLPKNIADSFIANYNWTWHFIAFALTFILATTGFDWDYYQFLRNTPFYKYSFLSAALGFLLPYLVPIGLMLYAWAKKSTQIFNAAFAIAQAQAIALLVTSFYKFFTGRTYPPRFGNTDISRIFHFGIYRNSVFFGWPSSHTAVAFAAAVALIILFPKNKILKYLVLLYALFIGIGVSISIHWFSDFVAGAIMGTVIGIVVGKSFKNRIA